MSKIIDIPVRGPVKRHNKPQLVKIGPLMRRAILEEILSLAVAIELAPPHEKAALWRQLDTLQDFWGGSL